MAILAKSSGGKFELAPAGNHVAICYAVYDMGTQPGFEGKATRKVRICWELSNEEMSDGRPFGVSKLYTLSLNDKATLYKDLIGWRGRAFTEDELKAFDLANLLGVPAMVQIIHDEYEGKKFANIASVGGLAKGMMKPTPVNPLIQFSIDDDEVPSGTPEWIAKKIEESEEWRHRNGRTAPANGSAKPATSDADDDPSKPPF